jgi:putative ABC transport system permease protein
MEVDPVFRRLRSAHGLLVIARRKPGVSLNQARENMDVISKRLEREYSDNQGHYANVVPLADALHDEFRPAALALLGAAALVLLIACFNVANLMLARAMARARETGTRLALGAARSRIARQFLVESLVFALAGALLGIAIAWGAVFLLRSVLPPNPSILPADVRVDRLNLAAAAGLACLTSLICGTMPAFRAAGASLGDLVRAGERQQTASAGQSWSRSAFVVSETALALVLLIGAGLLLRSFWKLQTVNPGFRPEKLLTLQLVLPPAYGTDERTIAFQERMLVAARALPGVRSAGFTSFLPLTGQNMRRGLEIEGVNYQGREPRRGNVRVASPGYLEAMQIPVLRGRSCRNQDIQHAPAAALINQTAARLYWEGREPLGTRARLAGMGDWATVVGITGDVKHFGLEEGARPEMYLCSYQVPAMMNMVVRTEREPEQLISAVRLKLREIDREIPPFELRSMEDVMAEAGSQRRFLTLLVAVFAALALALAASGIYAQLAYWVARRTPEIGIRIALGARPGQVMGLVLRQGLTLAGTGLAIGLAIALGLAGMIEKLLFGVAPLDTPTLVMAPLLLSIIAGLACMQPAWRASRADPATTLRHD